MNSTRLLLPACFALSLVACGGGGDDPAPSRVSLETLSGFVTAPGGTGLPGVTVHFEGREALTDASGVFLLAVDAQLPPGTFLVGLDGTTSSAVGTYPELEVAIDLSAGDTNVALPQVITLPDLSSAEAANQSIAVSGTGATLGPITLVGPDGDLGLTGPTGTVVTMGGQPAAIGVDFNVTPVPPAEVPMPLPEGLLASSFVTIQPGNGRFAAPGGGGLDVRLPNDAQLPIGTEVDVWSFDHDAGDWVNRSQETGQRGTVVNIGAGATAVDAAGVITEGGWHAPVIPIDPDCATTIAGQICDVGGEPAPGISISTSLGQFTTTDANGNYTLSLVPAYDAQDVNCAPVGLNVNVVSAPIFGSTVSATLPVGSGQIVQGGVTDLGKTELDLPDQGCVSGFVQGELANPAAGIAIDGPTTVTVFPSRSGNFHACQLDPGAYTATATLDGQSMPTVVPFTVTANGVATITITGATGGGSGTLNVQIRQQAPGGTMGAVIPGALVFVEGTDPTSSGGLQGMTNGQGIASFQNVTGPFRVTAWSETPFSGGGVNLVFREASTAVGLNPPVMNGTQTVTLALLTDLSNPGGGGNGATLNATVSGSVIGNAGNCPLEIELRTRGNVNGGDVIIETVEGVLANYSIDVPAGQLVDVSVRRLCPGGATAVSDGGIITAIPALAAGETRTVDIDFGSSDIIPFDQTTTVTLGNDQAMGNTNRSADFELLDAVSGVSFDFDPFDLDSMPAPTMWDVPNTSTGVFAGYETFVGYNATGDSLTSSAGTTQYEQLRLGNPIPQTIAFNLLDVPTLSSPGLPLTTNEPDAPTFNVAWPAAQQGLDGFDQLILGSTAVDMTGSGTVVLWSYYQDVGAGAIQLPGVADAILEDGEVTVNMFSFRLDEDTDFQAAFGPMGTGFPLAFQPGASGQFLDVTRVLQSSNGFGFTLID